VQLDPLVVLAPIKFTGNKNGSAFVGIDKDYKSVAECRADFKAKSCDVLNKLASDKEIEIYIKSEKFNIAKSASINQYYNRDNIVLIGDAAHPFKPLG
jgi:2-polyprenyl-6-methoxyphenol hydroxylase-like FAD-dependent oxidoreductase